MTRPDAPPLRRTLRMTRDTWDQDDIRPAVREAFAARSSIAEPKP